MVYTFDEDYTLDLQRYKLGCSGQAIELESQVFDVLVYLIPQRHRVVTKDELVAHIWGWPIRQGSHTDQPANGGAPGGG